MANNITWADRTDSKEKTGETYENSADIYNTLKAWANSPAQTTRTLTADGGVLTIPANAQGDFNSYSISSDETWNAAPFAKGNVMWFNLVVTGTPTITKGTGFVNDYNDLFGTILTAGTYRVMIATLDSVGVDISVPLLVSTAFSNWTNFNGTSNYITFGNILGDVFGGADKRWAVEVEIRNWDNADLHRLISAATNVGGTESMVTTYIATNQEPNITVIETSGSEQVSIKSTTLITTPTTVRFEYDGTNDASALGRLAIFFDNIPQSETSVNSAGLPWDLTNRVCTFSFGDKLDSAGTPTGSFLFDGEARDLIVQSSVDGVVWVDELNVPDLSTGTDTSGNGYDGTFV